MRRLRSRKGGAARDAVRDEAHARKFAELRRTVLQGLGLAVAGVGAFALVIAILWHFFLADDLTAPASTEARSSFGEGSSSALPFGKGNATPVRDVDPATVDVSMLRQSYFASENRHAFYTAVRGRPEPEAKYLAWRAAHDCVNALRQMTDSVEIDQVVAEAVGREGGGPEQVRQRQQAGNALKQMCGGFLHPGKIPYAEMFRLLGEAVAAAHPAALAAQRTPATDLVVLVRLAVQSGDPLAFAEAAPALSRLAFTHRIAGVDVSGQTVFAMQIAIDAATCRVAASCAPGSPRAIGDCVHGAACELPSIADHLLESPLLDANHAMARKLAADIEAAVRRRDAAALVAVRR